MNCYIFTNINEASNFFELLFKCMNWKYSDENNKLFLPSKEWLRDQFSKLRDGEVIYKKITYKGVIYNRDKYLCVIKIGNIYLYGLNPKSEYALDDSDDSQFKDSIYKKGEYSVTLIGEEYFKN